jgi:O-succinylbenzoate synthase
VTVVRAIELRLIRLPLVRPFRTSFGQETEKECILARVETGDAVGWGECVAGPDPGFSEEFNQGAWLVLRDFLAPALFQAGGTRAEDLERVFAFVRGNPMAKATLSNAILDAELRARGESLATYLGADKDRVACGVSVGIPPSTEQLLEQVAEYLADGYRRVKLKIQPGLDIERVAAVREANPGATLSVDANAAYSLGDVETFRALDAFDLLMVEQPLHQDDLVEHSKLQR